MAATQEIEIPVYGMDCAECVLHVEAALQSLPGVVEANSARLIKR